MWVIWLGPLHLQAFLGQSHYLGVLIIRDSNGRQYEGWDGRWQGSRGTVEEADEEEETKQQSLDGQSAGLRAPVRT